MIKETKPARYIVFQKGVIQFAMNFKKRKNLSFCFLRKKVYLFVMNPLSVWYQAGDISLVLIFMTVLQGGYYYPHFMVEVTEV